MASITVRPASFVQTGTRTWSYTFDKKEVTVVDVIGTVELVIGSQVVVATARRFDDGEIAVAGFVGRYQTSNKAWPANVRFAADGEVRSAWFGRDDRSARFNKLQGISYEPATWASVANPKVYTAD